MRRVNVEPSLSHYTRQQVADMLGVHISTLRRLARELREVAPEFNFQPHDGLIPVDAVNQIIEYRNLSEATTTKRAKEHIRKKGI
jgi:hypothetical protein